MADEVVQPIIIRKKKAAHGHHGGAWKVAYADFVTAMMALFIVLWLLSSSEQTKKAIGGYFQDPEGRGKLMGSGLAGTGESLMLKREDFDQLKEKIEAAVKKIPELEKMRDQMKLTVTGEGLRIELLETSAGVFFASGSPKPSEICVKMLTELAHQLGKMQNNIVIEGHTDSAPFGDNRNYNNWDLSSDRANSARRTMQLEGLREGQVAQVRGFADQQLYKKDDPGHPSNRRITIIVQYDSPHPDATEPAKAAAGEHHENPPAKSEHHASK